MPNKTPEGGKPLSLEKTMQKLDNLVGVLESEDVPLEKALSAFESGIKLVREAQQALAEAEQKVALLLEESDGKLVLEEILDEDDE